LILISCSGDSGPQPGTPAYDWAAAKQTFAAGDYAKTLDNLDRVVATENEFTPTNELPAFESALIRGEDFDQPIACGGKTAPWTVYTASIDYTIRCRKLDAQQTEQQIVFIAMPFWEQHNRYQAGIHYFQEIDRLYPGRWWVRQDIGDLAAKLGQQSLADQSFADAKRLKEGGM